MPNNYTVQWAYRRGALRAARMLACSPLLYVAWANRRYVVAPPW